MSFFEFPNTRTYDSDLGWLIRTVKELTEEYTSLLAWMKTHKSEYANLLRRVDMLENSINSFENEVNQRFEILQKQLSSEIYRQLQQALAEINTSLGDISGRLETLRSEVIRNRIYAHNETVAYFDLANDFTDAKIQELINSIPDLTTVNVFNPVRGEVTNIQTAVDDLYELGRAEGLMALEYDSLGLTASQYDALELTAIEYDQYGRYYLEQYGFIKNPFHYMTSPFTGEEVTLQTVINELVSLHKDDALTADEYDTLAIDADYYDSLLLSANDYDWHGKTLVA